MQDDNRNLILAIALSLAVLLAWGFLFPQEPPVPEETEITAPEDGGVGAPGAGAPQPAAPQAVDSAPGGAGAPPAPGGPAQQAAAATQATGPRIAIETPALEGSIALVGGRIDDLKLLRYRETVDPDSPVITLLSPPGTENPYYVELGWQPRAGDPTPVPKSDTTWRATRTGPLTADNPVRLVWENGAGLTFIREISIDENYMLTVTQRVENAGARSVDLFPYALILRRGQPEISGFFILHEGFLGVFDETLEEVDYDDLEDEPAVNFQSTGGWFGITDKYWLTALIPDQSSPFTARFSGSVVPGAEFYQADYLREGQTVAPGGAIETSNRVFAGAKKVDLLEAYRDDGVVRFDLAVDWGWFFFLTKPLFWALDTLGGLVGNFGVAILIVTVIIKLVLFPLANKSYEAMSKMKKLQPKMVQLRERYADDKMKQQQELMELYKREKVNPAAGCLPIVVQIPVFFALYKVLFVTIDMRHAPFFGWIQDLSAPDPTSIFNLFGLLPFTPPDFLMIGVWPIIMGVTMFVQTKLNPPPADPMQEKIFLFMPVMFTFLLAQFSAGLVIYWAWNNFLSVAQQYVIMRRMGVEIDLIDQQIPKWLGRQPAKPEIEGRSENSGEADADTSDAEPDKADDKADDKNGTGGKGAAPGKQKTTNKNTKKQSRKSR